MRAKPEEPPSDGLPPLADLPPFRTVSKETLAWLRGELGWSAIAAGGVLFAAGDPGETLYIVINGLLGVIIATPDRGQELVAELRPGETCGEMSMLTGERHSATVVALRHSEVYGMPKAVFDRLIEIEPHFIVWLARLLVARLHRTTFRTPAEETHDTVALVPADRGVPIDEVAVALEFALRDLGARTAHLGPADAGGSPDQLGRLGEAHDILLFRSADATDRWSQFCLREADRILLVARPGSRLDDPLRLPPNMLAGREKPLDLVIVEPPGAGRLGTVPRDAERFAQILRIRLGHPGDAARLARHVAGCALGLVLSGGAARGFAHIGAVAALRESGLAIDQLGGTSMGAIVAAGIASGWDDAELRERMHHAFVRRNPLNDYTIPWIALYKGRSVDRLLAENFGDSLIEALWLPFYCVSTNLSRGKLQIHRSGSVARALRASAAIPGVLPPVVEGRDVLVDGGVIDVFPVDVMRGAGRSRVIGIDVAEDEALMLGTEVPPRPNLLLRLIRPRPPEVPGIVSVLSRVGTVSSRLQRTISRSQVDLLIEPDLGNVPLLDWRGFDRTVEAGRVAALRALDGFAGGIASLTRFSRSRP
ncbi:MAG TPA: patatin-like phospholipase family protein [Stellaceae bacterium]|nr:patatin-like phospholipase family protein [Stellaceae bacterium]